MDIFFAIFNRVKKIQKLMKLLCISLSFFEFCNIFNLQIFIGWAVTLEDMSTYHKIGPRYRAIRSRQGLCGVFLIFYIGINLEIMC